MENISLYMMKCTPKPTQTNSSPFKCQYQQVHTEVSDCSRFSMDSFLKVGY